MEIKYISARLYLKYGIQLHQHFINRMQYLAATQNVKKQIFKSYWKMNT